MSRLAVATTDALILLDRHSLKDPPLTVPSACNFLAQPTSITWSPNNASLFLSLPDAIEKYDTSGAHIDTVYSTHSPAIALLAKDKGSTIIYAARNEVTVLEAHSQRVVHTFATHRNGVVALALSSDATLLASISANAAHVYDLSQSPSAHVVLRGFPSGTFTVCAFHPHARTRLLLGIGLHIAVYDTTRTAGPVKTFNLEKGAGDIVAITSSPFSKTLIAVACAGGNVTLIDLEKEKGVIQTVPMQVPLTSLAFSPEGAALYAGTMTGQILILDLRGLNKPPKTVTVSLTGQRVVCMAMQRKLRQDATLKLRSSVGEGRPSHTEQQDAGKEKKPVSRRIPTSLTSPPLKKTASSSSLTSSKPKTSKAPAPSPGLSRAQTLPSSSATTRTRMPASSSDEVVPLSPVIRPRAISTATSTSLSSRVTSSSSSRPATASSRTTVSTSPSMRKVGASKPQAPAALPRKSPLSRSASEEDQPDARARIDNLHNLPKARRTKNLRVANRDDGQMTSTATTSRVVAASRVSTRQGVRSRTVSSSTIARPSTGTAPRSRVASMTSPSSEAIANGSAAVTSALTNADRNEPLAHLRRLSAASSVSIPRVTIDGSRADSSTEQLTAINIAVSRTPSPDVASQAPPVPPLDVKGKGKERDREREKAKESAPDVLGPGPPGMQQWVTAGTFDGRDEDDDDPLSVPREHGHGRVGFLDLRPPAPYSNVYDRDDNDNNDKEVQIQSIEVLPAEKAKVKPGTRGRRGEGGGRREAQAEEATIKMTVQISPRRPATRDLTRSGSPLRGAALLPGLLPGSGGSGEGGGGGAGSASTNPAHDLLQALIRDSLYDFRRETRAEIIGVHLDLVKMGRAWRKEMREALDKWSKELQEVREENQALRKENERLRRGY